VTVGGPIKKDRVWFFGAFDYLRSDSLPPRWSLVNQSWRRYADAKVSFLPSQKHLIWGAYHYENNNGNGWSWGSSPRGTPRTRVQVACEQHGRRAVQWTPAGKTVVSAKFSSSGQTPNLLPTDRPDHPGYINWWKWADYGINGAFPYVDTPKASRQTIQGDLSHYTEGFLGQHDLKFGVQYTKGRGNRQEGYFQNYVNFLYPYRWTQNVEQMQSWYGDTGLLFYNYKDTINPFLTVRTADTAGAFIDDKWTPTKRLTVTLGLRFDHMTTRYDAGKVYEFATSPEEAVAPPPVLRDRASTGNIFDFKTWSPRLGVSYALTEDGKTVARAAWPCIHPAQHRVSQTLRAGRAPWSASSRCSRWGRGARWTPTVMASSTPWRRGQRRARCMDSRRSAKRHGRSTSRGRSTWPTT
jgi:outer membrane receptor protein involved in Fe transport